MTFSVVTGSRPRKAAGLFLACLLGGIASGMVPAAATADSIRDAQWHLKFLGVPKAQKLSQGEGVTVAVIDTGVNARHRDLTGNVLPGVDGFRASGKGWTDYHDHGTRMASLIAGHGHGSGHADGVMGIAPKAKILPITVVGPGERGAGRGAVAEGVGYAVDHNADIILIALSGPAGEGEQEAIDAARTRNIPVIAAAGNATSNGGTSVGYPAAHEGVLAVSAVDRHGTFFKRSASGNKIGLAAPGVDLEVAGADGGYAKGSGTSEAAAVVAGLAALVKAKFPAESATDLVIRLGGTARDRGPKGRDDEYGLGIPDVTKALSLAEPPRTSPSATPSSSGAAATHVAVPEAPPVPRVVILGRVLVGLLILAVLITIGYLAVRRARRPPGAPRPGPSPFGPPGAPPGPPGPPGAAPPGAPGTAPGGQPDDVWKRQEPRA